MKQKLIELQREVDKSTTQRENLPHFSQLVLGQGDENNSEKYKRYQYHN